MQAHVFKDFHLALVVLVLVIVDLLILAVYTAVEGVKGNLSAHRMLNKENPMDMIGVSYMHGNLTVITSYGYVQSELDIFRNWT